MFCSKCGSKIDKKSNFCGKCGTKINKVNTIQSIQEEKSEISPDVNNLDSFIGNIVKRTNEQSIDSDIFTKIDKGEVNVKNVPKKSVKVKKSKVKVKSKPKKVNKPLKRSGNKKIGSKILIPAILIPLSTVIAVFVFMFFNGKKESANRDVAKAFKTTLVQIEKHADKIKMLPNFSRYKNLENKNFEVERYLKIKNAKGGLLNEDVLGNLKGISVKINEKHHIEKDLFNIKLSLANRKNEEISGEVFSSPELSSLKMPNIYGESLGMHFKQAQLKEEGEDQSISIDSKYYNEISQMIELLKNGSSYYDNYMDSLKEKSGTLINNIIKNAEFILENEDEITKEREYSAKLENKIMLETLKEFLIKIEEDEFNKKLQSFFSYFIKDESLKLAEYITIGSPDRLIAAIDAAIEAEELKKDEDNKEIKVENGDIQSGDIAEDRDENLDRDETRELLKETQIKLITNENQTVRSLSFNISIEKIIFLIKIDIEDNEDLLNQKINIKMNNADTYLVLDIESSTNSSSDYEINRTNMLKLSTFLGDNITIDFNESYNSKTNDYNNKINFGVDSSFEDFFMDYNLKGKYKNEDSLQKLDINSLKINVDTGLYKYDIEFDGYIQKHNSNSMEIVNFDNITFIDNMSNKEIEDIKLEIKGNWEKLLQLFREKKW